MILFPVFVVGIPYFVLDEGGRRCFIEEVPEEMLIVGHYRNLDWPLLTLADQQNQILVEVRDSRSNLLLQHETVEEGQFGFTSSTAGEHQICVSASATTTYGQQKSFRFQMILDFGEQAEDYSSIAKAEHLSAMKWRSGS